MYRCTCALRLQVRPWHAAAPGSEDTDLGRVCELLRRLHDRAHDSRTWSRVCKRADRAADLDRQQQQQQGQGTHVNGSGAAAAAALLGPVPTVASVLQVGRMA